MKKKKIIVPDFEEIDLETYLKKNASPCDLGFGDQSIEELIKIGNAVDSTKPLRIISDWYWFDVQCTQSEMKFYDKYGIKPAYLMAYQILHDTTQPQSIGNWVRTSPLLEFIKPGVFVTKNRIYIMAGNGSRMIVDDDFISLIG